MKPSRAEWDFAGRGVEYVENGNEDRGHEEPTLIIEVDGFDDATELLAAIASHLARKAKRAAKKGAATEPAGEKQDEKPKLKCGGAPCHDSADGNSEVHNPNDPTCKRSHKES